MRNYLDLFSGSFKAISRRRLRLLALAGTLLGLCLPRAEANPQGGTVVQGSASFTTQGSQFNVTTSDRAFINWGSFNIAAGESTTFFQPSASSVVWNRIDGATPSQIFGNLQANGLVILQNQSGFFIGPHAVITANGLIMTTASSPPPDFSSAGPWSFNEPPPLASIINYGRINIGAGGSAFLIARDLENRGTITAPNGNIGLYAGKQVLVSERPDGRGLSAQVQLPEGSVDNSGNLIADAGTIALRAQVVNQGGLIQANSIRERNGVIELVASDALTLGPASTIEAKGDAQGTSAGGNILLKSDNAFNDQPTSTINVSGGAAGGHGGQVEISATKMDVIQSQIDGHATAGWLGGTLLIDPLNITLSSTGDAAGSGVVNAGDLPDTLTLNPNSFASFSQILLQAVNNITVASSWNLADSIDPTSTLTLQAGNNIQINNNAGITAGKNWSVNLIAGADFNTATSVVHGAGPNAHGIYLNGSAFLQTFNGNIGLWVGNDIIVNTGAIRTMGGGSISALALSGNVNTGSNQKGYSFSTIGAGYSVNSGLGGISTAAGGDVTISAGRDVTSFLPSTTSTSQADAGTGAFGPQHGNVTITAGGNIYGHYVVANGNGLISAGNKVIAPLSSGGNAGSTTKLLALSLVKGGWDVEAPNGSIALQEVRNPNGIFNKQGSFSTPTRHLFDYDPNAFVNLNAGNGVQLTGGILPRNTGENIPVIYPPTLTIEAGAGGVVLGNDVTLFPSAFGNLNITTTAGGSFVTSQPGTAYNLNMSDSGSQQFVSVGDFGPNDHAPVPIQLNNPNPVVLNISGDVKDLIITTPKETHITVGGEMDNTSFSGQNLHATDKTSITVAGRLWNRNNYTFDFLTTAQALDPADPFKVLRDAVTVANGTFSPQFANGNPGFVYNPTTKRLGFFGKMTPEIEQALLKLKLPVLQSDGTPQLDANGVPITVAATFVDPSVIASLYANSQDIPNARALGYQLGGPGQFNITASSLDLGITQGIISWGPGLNTALGPVAPHGAAVNLDLTGNLDMFSSTIASFAGGSIFINSGGTINVGSQDLLGSSDLTRGIYTSGHGDVTVIAQGTINVDGSRIAAYAGGNVSVTSLTGDVLAGNGGDGIVRVTEVNVDPLTGNVDTHNVQIAGSGILATTLPDAPLSDTVGNITITTPRGDIIASEGGIAQVPLNGNVTPGPYVNLTAGTRDPADPTKTLYAGNIDVTGSGVIGGDVHLDAAGNIKGLVVARGNSSVTAVQNFSGIVLAAGSASVNAGESISGTIIGVGGISVSSSTMVATLLSQNVSVDGASANSALASSVAASSTSQAAAQETSAAEKTETSKDDTSADDDEKKRSGGKRPTLMRSTGRVTVILPKT